MVEAKQKDSATERKDPGSDGAGRNSSKARSGKKDKKEASGGGTGTGGGASGNSKRNKKAKKDVVKPPQKVVIRRLPPSMDEETLRKQIEPIPDHEDFYFVSGDWSLGKNASSRAYISFTRTEDIFLFRDKFDGYIFVDSKGVEYPAVVEYAPFQELPRNRSRKKDAKQGTIETDTHFLAFQEALEAEEKESSGGKGKGKLEYSYTIKDEKRITSTPLLEFIAQKRQEKRDEKRKKLEEKKKQRKEERQKKISKPEVIKEEEKAKEDDIVVRTVPSRLDPKQAKKEGGRKEGGADKKDEIKEGKDGKEKEKRQRNRGKDKDKEDRTPKQPEKEEPPIAEQEKPLSRKQERDRQRREKEKVRKQEEREKKAQGELPRKDSKPAAVKAEVTVEKPVETRDVPKKEVKKYSERRKETRARAENRLAELEDRKDFEESITSEHFKLIPVIPKVDIKKSNLTPHVAPFIPKEKSSTIILGESSLSLPPAFPQKSSTPTAPQLPSGEQTEQAEPDHGSEPQTPSENNSCEKKSAEIESKLQEAREARKLRNKNRPSIEIYQPRKRIQPGAPGTNTKSEDEPQKEKSDSDRSSDVSGKPGMSSGGGPPKETGTGAKDKRHRLTKKASDKERPRDRRNRRKNSSDNESAAKDSRKNSREDTTPEEPKAEAIVKPEEEMITEVAAALEGVKLDS
ncbi:regulator of nonsense transcripts 3B [Uranotaenia lowii]|uniref:regulator of nonsense transcripts 3B n=1 Tax=Uranotaenia lowii TaxID=190385 RepID=UPI0024788DA6|nr:regulator of nonsense transcripts 3B [Uranotaenia lowii]